MNDEIKLEIEGFCFSWDDNKAEINKRKHGISFFMASEVFFDKYAYEEPDYTTDEERYRIIGRGQLFNSPVLFVVYTERVINDEGKQVLRIISARKAKGKELDKYYEVY